MGKLRVGSRGVYVEYSDTLDQLARRALEQVAPGVLEEAERRLGDVLTTAQGEWPVKTGVSRAGLDLVSSVDPDVGALTVEIRNDVKYAIYVRPKTFYGATTAWARLVQKPGRVALRELGKMLGPVVLRRMRGQDG